MEAVAEALGRPEAPRAAAAERRGVEWDALCREAAAYSIATAVEEEYLEASAKRDFFYGFNPYRFYADLGFSQELILIDGRGRQTGALSAGEESQKLGLIDCPDSAAITFYRTDLPGLGRALKNASAQLLYSDIPGDQRAARAGKIAFSVAELEMGPEGAFRTLRRLLRYCRTPFYRRYHGFLPGARSW